jgi:cytidine deaminase
VGAVLETPAGARYAGANVEFASYGLTQCAERAALVRAVVDGERAFTRIAVARADGEPITPCGACRQALAEFGTDLAVVFRTPAGLEARRLRALLPEAFVLREDGRTD